MVKCCDLRYSVNPVYSRDKWAWCHDHLVYVRIGNDLCKVAKQRLTAKKHTKKVGK